MLKIYLRELLEEYAEEIDLINAANLVKMEVDDLLVDIIQDINNEKKFLLMLLMFYDFEGKT